ncbi:type II toxin-antitoxin system MqsR family toxin [Desulfobacterales bacterium HSG16]|nr:type II toxin-antitoxin system MqsR family toxin [Desulfobacterales bacterium HSG16]
MDKRKPTYRLEEIRQLAEQGLCRLTMTAQRTADSLGFSQTEVQHIISQLDSRDFYKSVNEYQNPRVWQDVYKKTVCDINLYIKLKVIDDGNHLIFILSFKEE